MLGMLKKILSEWFIARPEQAQFDFSLPSELWLKVLQLFIDDKYGKTDIKALGALVLVSRKFLEITKIAGQIMRNDESDVPDKRYLIGSHIDLTPFLSLVQKPQLRKEQFYAVDDKGRKFLMYQVQKSICSGKVTELQKKILENSIMQKLLFKQVLTLPQALILDKNQFQKLISDHESCADRA